jgi:hypothetical protein
MIFDPVKENIEEFQNSEKMYALVSSGEQGDIGKLDKLVINDKRMYIHKQTSAVVFRYTQHYKFKELSRHEFAACSSVAWQFLRD